MWFSNLPRTVEKWNLSRVQTICGGFGELAKQRPVYKMSLKKLLPLLLAKRHKNRNKVLLKFSDYSRFNATLRGISITLSKKVHDLNLPQTLWNYVTQGGRTVAETTVSQTQVARGSFLQNIWRNIHSESFPRKCLSFENYNDKEEIVSLWILSKWKPQIKKFLRNENYHLKNIIMNAQTFVSVDSENNS